jgi:hypothetical protein
MPRWLVVPLFFAFLTLGSGAAAAAAGGGRIDGTVGTADGRPVSGARVTVAGPANAVTASDARGAFHVTGLPPGTYVLHVERAGFEPADRSDVDVVPPAPATVDVILTGASFSSLREIGRATSASASRNAIDAGSAPVAVVSGQQFADQGRLELTQVLNEIPGVITTTDPSAGGNGASLGNPAVPQIRGALSYETESLIDGHPVSVGANGDFSPLLVNPALLQDVEIAKGPSTNQTEINYAIGGSVNYRTLEPTRTPVLAFDAGVDGNGGVNTSARATGSTLDGRLDYAFALATIGTPGPLHPFGEDGSQLVLAYGAPPYTIDGRQYVGSPIGFAPGNTPAYAGVIGLLRFAEPLYLCCAPVTTGFTSRGELGKLRFNFSDATALTVSYLGGQSFNDLSGERLASLQTPFDFSTFAPPPGYTGSVAAGTPIPFDNQNSTYLNDAQQQNLFQAELRTTAADTTILARAYAGYSSDVLKTEYPIGTPLSVTENAWGTVLLCPAGATASGATCDLAGGGTVAPSPTSFDGQPVTLVTNGPGAFAQTVDRVRGASVEVDRPFGAAVASLALDRSTHDSWQFAYSPTDAENEYTLPPGSRQDFTTLLARLAAPLAHRVSGTLSNYAIWYGSHFTGDGGATWNDSVHAFDAPRFGLSWRPEDDVAVRASLGASIAPPYLALLSAPAGAPVANTPGAATAYLLNENNGRIAPEEAFGYDVGADWRIRPRLTLSSDVYLTNVRDLFLQQTSQQGTYTPVSGVDAGNTQPLYITQAQNLAHARYEGVETALVAAPPAGLGFTLNVTLMRAYAYGIMPSLYATAAGPYTANLGVLPNVNFQSSGTSFNGLSNGRVPYAQGYGEVNFRTRGDALFWRLGAIYFGPNNAYNRPPFADVSASARLRLGARASVEVAGDNLTNAYGAPYMDAFGGIPVVLANRAAGATTGYLGATAGFNLGPPSVRLDLRYALGDR